MERIAVYPGSFDPVTNGHLDIVRRGLKLFDRVVVAILVNPKKQFLFPLEERLDMLRVCLQDFKGAEVDAADGLLVDYAARHGATAILRGLRTLSDYDYEVQMALFNRRLDPRVETVFVVASPEHAATNSGLVKEVSALGRDVSAFVTEPVRVALERAFRRRAGK